MEDITYTKGIYTATASIRKANNEAKNEANSEAFQGVVTLSRDEGPPGPELTVYEVDTTSSTPHEAMEEAKALAHRILGKIEL